MGFLLSLIRSLDVNVYHFLNAYAGHPLFDRLAAFEEENDLLKGGLLLAAYSYLWFRNDKDQDNRRRQMIAIFTGTLLAIVVCRIIADVVPFRIRPMYDPGLSRRPHSFSIVGNMERWSSFPSDTAAYFGALSFGLRLLFRRYGALLALYTAAWICLPRMFLGEHFLSEIIVGSSIGIATVWLCTKTDWLRLSVANGVLSFADARPGVFYAAAFLAFFEMGVMFGDLRSAAHLVFNVSFHLLPVAGALLAFVIAAVYAMSRVSTRFQVRFAPWFLLGVLSKRPHPPA